MSNALVCRRQALHWLVPVLLVALAPAKMEAQNPDLTFHPVLPCTVVDTRVAGGAFAASETRTYNVVGSGSLASQGGSATGCGVPGFSNGIAQVQAVALIFTSVSPTGAGFILADAADRVPGVGGVLNFAAGDVLTNSSPVAVAQTSGVGDFKVTLGVSGSHVLIRVVGYYSKAVQTVYVHPVPGNNTASGTTLLNAMSGITNASATKRYVIQLEPGIYDLGSSKLIMKPYVDLKGAGQEATVIQGGGFSSSDDGVVWGAASAEVSNLQIKSTGGSTQSAVAFYSPSEAGATWLHNVTFVASGGSGNWGVRAAGGSPVIEECTIRVQGGAYSYGIVGRGTSRPAVKRTVIEVVNGTSEGYGMLFVTGSSPVEARDIQIRLTGAGSSAYGIYIDEVLYQYITRITNSTVEVGGATTTRGIRFNGLQLNVEQSQVRATGSNSIGVDTALGETVIDHSEITGTLSTVNSAALGDTRIGATRLDGGAVVAAFPTCAGVYDESFTFFAGPACP